MRALAFVIALGCALALADIVWFQPEHPMGEWRVILVDGITDPEGDTVVKGPSYATRQRCFQAAARLNSSRIDTFSCALVFQGGTW